MGYATGAGAQFLQFPNPIHNFRETKLILNQLDIIQVRILFKKLP